MKTKYLIQAGLIAALYAALTVLLGAISYGPVQLRVAEAMTVLPALTPAAVPGLFAGCLISNMLGPYGAFDMITGSLATLTAAFCSYTLSNKPLLVPLPPVIINGIVIGSMLYYVYGVPFSLAACIGWVALGQFISCYIMEYPLLLVFRKHKNIFE